MCLSENAAACRGNMQPENPVPPTLEQKRDLHPAAHKNKRGGGGGGLKYQSNT